MLQNNYINTFIQTLESTKIQKKDGSYHETYTEGIQMLFDVFLEHKRFCSNLFFVGNGGSAAIASHMAADFMKNGKLNAYNLYDNALTTCIGNDYGYEYIFSKPMDFLVKKDDLVVAISSSGNSQNIINAIQTAKAKNAKVITFTGFSPDNKARQLGDINVYTPCSKYGIVESAHNLILQQIVDMILESEGASI